jgi:pimeloyl-ACP methyl ester carboxylesterase
MNIWQKLVAVNDTHLFCGRAGAGDVLVLVNGGGGDRRYRDEQFFHLAKEFDVVRYDLRGYGVQTSRLKALTTDMSMTFGV